MLSNFLLLHTSGGISSSPATLIFLIFQSTESSSSCVNCPSLMSNCLLIILEIGSCETFRRCPSRFSKCCSFLLSFLCALPSAQFVYRLPSNPRLSTFNRIPDLIDLSFYVFCLFFWVYVT